MDGIVIELQRNALDPSVDVVTLLRKALLVAKKLKLGKFEDWINKELNGYSAQDKCPDYRKATGQLRAWNPFNGWIPVLIPYADIYDTICTQSLRFSISNFISLARTDKGFHLSFNDTINSILNSTTNTPVPTKYALIVGNNVAETIIETVKTLILEWAIVLEDNGILGEGLSFTNEEKITATQNPSIAQYINNFFKDASDIQLQQGTVESDQTSGE